MIELLNGPELVGPEFPIEVKDTDIHEFFAE